MSKCNNCGAWVDSATDVEWCLECMRFVYECAGCCEIKDVRADDPKGVKGEAPSGLPLALCSRCREEMT